MSHSKERKEKVCLNCQATLYGRYCHECGQENIEPKQSAWHLVSHFFADITHFDGKFFTTLKDLVVKPGFLSREYIRGRRASYLNPVRMYVFTSAFFFVVFFSIVKPGKFKFNDTSKGINDSVLNLDQGMKAALARAEDKADSDEVRRAFARLKAIPGVTKADSPVVKGESAKDGTLYSDDGHDYKSIEEYDSVQAKLNPDLRDSWFRRMFAHKVISISKKYHEDKAEFFKEYTTALVHTFPQLLFISLPIFALLLKLLYVRHREYYYVDHGIFAIHLYIYSFIALLVGFGISGLKSATGQDWIGILEAVLYLFSLWYYYKAMRNFYLQGRGKTILKYILIWILAWIMIIFLFTFFIFFTAMEI